VLVLIAGCGWLGSALGEALAADGHEVLALRRDLARLPPGLRGIAADLTDAASLRRVPDGIDLAVYAAAAGRRDADAYRAAYVTGVERLVERLAAGGGARRLVYTSSTGVYGRRDGAWVDEATPPEPADATARLLLEGEARVAVAPFPGVVLRLGGLYGPGRASLVERVRRGEARYAPGPPLFTNRIHRDDAVAALRLLLFHAAPEPLVLGVDCEPAPEREVLEWLAARLGAPPPQPAPADPAGRRARSNKRCRNDRLRALGLSLRHPTYREGYAALLAGA
jgi:nucleoside-diphosphate-sugar epimerase